MTSTGGRRPHTWRSLVRSEASPLARLLKRRAIWWFLPAFVVACKMATDVDSKTNAPPPPANLTQIFAAACSKTSFSVIPATIPQLGTGTYLGQQGGNFPGGTNVMPTAHANLGYSMAAQVLPRDANGNVDLVNGKIVQVSVGASTAARVFAGDSNGIYGIYQNGYKPLADIDAAKNPKLVIVSGAQSAKSIKSWLLPNDSAWIVLDQRLAAAGVTPAQVQTAWFMLGETRAQVYAFPLEQQNYRDSMEVVIRMFKQRYPNTRIAYLSAHYYQGYRPGNGPEPNNYEQGFGLKWVIEDQILGQRNMNADPNAGPVVAPWLTWGTHLFSNGIIPNGDGLFFLCAEYDTLGIHLIRQGVDKAGPRMLTSFKTDPFSVQWWLNNTGQVGDLVWYDVNGNGIQDAGEPGMAGLTVTLSGPGVNRTATTGASGQYVFTGVPAGSYTVTVATPAGFIPTTTNAAGSNSTNDSDGSPASVTLPTNTTANASIDIGFTKGTGAIGDFVWDDLNRDGIQDAGEPGLAGVQVTLSGAANATTTTAADGTYAFGGLLAGTYTVNVTTPSGFSPTLSNQGADPLKDSNSSPVTVTLATNSSSDLAADAGFVVNLTGQIGDFVWNDANGNGIQDAGEPGMAGVAVTLTGPGGTQNGTTDGTGHYLFSGLGAGSYTVSVATPVGFVPSPSAQGGDPNTDSNGSPASVTLATNSSVDTSIDVGFTSGGGVIGDFIWDDLDRDGVQDVGEPGLPGVQVVLSGAATATTTTDATGHYSFASLFAGSYTITVNAPNGYSASPSQQGGNPLQDSDGSPASITLVANTSSDLSVDFGFTQNLTGQLGDFVWYDVNGNGIQDVAEPGISGVTMTLTGPGGPLTTTTDGTGHYVFSGLAAGAYTIAAATPAGFVPTSSQAPGSSSVNDSDGSPASVSLPTNASSDLSIDFGFTKGVGVIGDFVWNDVNGNGVQDAGEPGLSGVTVTLGGAASASTTTDANGGYVFGNLFAGTYTVTVATPGGYSASPSNQGGDPLKDSNASPATVTLATNASSDLSADFGFMVNLTGQIGDFIWYDVDGNGMQDAAEPGIAGLTVTLAGPGGPRTTVTDATGHYLFSSLAAGAYTVTVATPGGFIATTANAAGSTSGNDSDNSPASVTLATNTSADLSIDIGFTKGVGVIGDFVWDDTNGDGVQDAGEPGLTGLTVSLSGAASATTTTDASGHYVFGGLFAGAYTVTVAAPNGYTATASAQGGDPLKDSNGSPANVTLATNATAELSTDFGFKQILSGEIGDFIWYDVNGNGVQDAAEPGISGQTVTLNGPGGPRTTTTDGTGHYSFTGLSAGSYTVSVTTPNGFVPAPSSQGGDPLKDSNGSPASVTLATNTSTDQSIDIGFTKGTGAIGDFVWDDLNGDGVQDPGEPGLPGLTVSLTGTSTATTTTDATGHYAFGGLFAGTYTVTVALPSGYSATPSTQGGDPLKDSNGSPAAITLTTNASSDLSLDFGFIENKTAQIGDFVWYDVNGNGIQDAAEPGIAGLTVTLTGPGGPQTTTTDGTGHYTFTALASGSYSVSVATPAGFVASPSTQGADPLVDSNGSPAVVNLATNSSTNTSIDIGFTKGVGAIGDFVWDDLNGNGVQDAGEPGLAGLTVDLSGSATATTTTDATGHYVFGSLFAGSYTVTIATPAGYSASPNAQGGDPLKDSNGSPAAVTLANNASTDLSADFGFKQNLTGQIGDFVWYDVNENGVQDAAEPGIGGQTVTLSGPGGPRTTTTDGTGHYSFSGLGAGSYTVTVATPSGFVASPAIQGGDPLKDSNGSPATVTLAANTSVDVSVDFGFTQGNAVIGDLVWDDLNGNGVQDAGEPGLAGVTVTLSGAASATTSTDASGHYVFGNLFAGAYTVTVATPSGYSASPPVQGGDPLKDSNGSPATVTLTTNATSETSVDFGFVENKTGEVGDFIWYDVNGNGIQDLAEPGIAGLTVTLNGPGGPQTTTTDATGHYSFSALGTGSYTVTVATPAGFVATPVTQGSDALKDSNGSPAVVNLATNSTTDPSIDIGFTKGVGVIGDLVWDDVNGDGIQDAGETGLAGVTVTLSGDASATTTTDASGNFVFGNLFAGNYTVTVATPNGFIASPAGQGTDPLKDSNGSPATVTLAHNASTNLGVDFGFTQPKLGEIGDFVWYDVNENGVQDASEPGISGKTVTLTGPGGPQTTTTDGTGHYAFTGLAAGTYTITVATPNAFQPSPSSQGGDPTKDSNGSPATVSLATNATVDQSVDFGFTQGNGVIGDFVWDDVNADGVQDAGEPGLAGVTVTLSGAANATTTTDATGHYVFGSLFAGTYTVTISTPVGYSATQAGQGGDPLKDSNASPSTVVLATNASSDLSVDAGFVVNLTGQIGDLVWYDVNGNGVQDAAEPGIAGLTVSLTGPGGVQTATTDASGHYVFTGLGAGAYTVSVPTPSGFIATPSTQGGDPLKDSNGSPATVTLASPSSTDATIDIGFTKGVGVIGDLVWDDLNGNGVQDAGEPGIAGLTVTLAGTAAATTTTDASGNYVFGNLFAGAYTVSVATPAGYSPSPSNQGGDPLKDSNGSPASVTLAGNATSELAVDFGFKQNQVGEIGDFVWYDSNDNGIQDVAEPGISGVTVTLSGPGGPRTTTTDGTGHYQFTGLGAGSYTVAFTTPNNFVPTLASQGGDPFKDSNGSPASVSLATNSTVDNTVDAGFTQGNGAIGDFVWDDLNGNGVQDAGEPGLPGVNVTLSGATSATTASDASGHYVFGNLFAGTYQVSIATPAGYRASPASQGGDPLKDSNASPATVVLATNASTDLSIDAGFVVNLTGQIGDYVWYDVNGNGVQDVAEPGIAGVTVTLTGPGGPLTTATDGSGHYLFTGLGAGAYTITVAAPNGFVPAPVAQGGDPLKDSNGSPAAVTLASPSSTDASVDIGFTKGVGVIGDLVWDDLNGNGEQDAGEPGLAGVTVTLSGAATAGTTTDANGNYAFGNLFAGSYTVTVSTPAGYSPTPSNQGGDPLKDSNGSPATVSLTTNASADLSVDLGFKQNLVGEIGDFIWYDVNGNGVQDVAEPGIASLSVTLTGPGGPRTTTTDATGHYAFTGLGAGSYSVSVTTPNGFVPAPSSQGGDPAKDSNGSPASVTLSTNASVDHTADIGFTQGTGVIGDFVWDDLNGNGVQDAGEPGIAGVTVTLGGAASGTTTTDGTGHYVFGSLFAGSYTVSVATPSGYSATQANQGGDPLKDSDILPASVVLATNASADLSVDAGFVVNLTGQIGDFVWYDVNGNGIQDVAESGIAGLTVTLAGPGGPQTTTTDASGHYLFSGLAAGAYTVSVATPNGFVPSPLSQGGDPLKDSNGSPAAVSLASPSSTDVSADIGFTKGVGVIGDFVWDDLNGNGVQDAGEPGLAGLTVTLSGAAAATTTTDASGNYVFGSLFAGSYTVTVATPSGYSATPSNQGGDPLKDSNGSPASVNLSTNASSDLAVDFGFKQNLSGQVGDFVWSDANGNGIQDAGESGLSGLTVTLNGPGGPRTATTDGTGHYTFSGLGAGSYTVTVATPNGYVATPTAQGGDPLTDSNGSPATVVLATNTSTDASIDIGFTRGTGSIGDFVWSDTNGNGIQDAGESGISGVTVTLSGAASASTTTAANGSYSFGNLFAGSYTVTVATPSGFTNSPSNQGSDPLTDSNGSPAAVTLAANNSSNAGIDFGFVPSATGQIGDFVWNDLNYNGIQDAGEPGLAGVTVTLSGAKSATTTTAANGSYAFTNLAAGNYTVTVTTPGGYSPTLAAQGSDPLKDSNASPASVTLATSSTVTNDIDFGFVLGKIITLDRTSTANTGSSLRTSLSWSHTITSGGTNRILLVSVGIRNKSSQTVSTVRWGGVNLTRIAGVSQGTNLRSEMWYLINPATGTNTIAVTISGSAAAMVGGAISYTGVHQTTPLGTAVTKNLTATRSASLTVASAYRDVVVDGVVKQNTNEQQSAAAGQVRRWIGQTTISPASDGAVLAGSDKPGAPSVTMSWTSSASRPWAMVAVPLKPAP